MGCRQQLYPRCHHTSSCTSVFKCHDDKESIEETGGWEAAAMETRGYSGEGDTLEARQIKSGESLLNTEKSSEYKDSPWYLVVSGP